MELLGDKVTELGRCGHVVKERQWTYWTIHVGDGALRPQEKKVVM